MTTTETMREALRELGQGSVHLAETRLAEHAREIEGEIPLPVARALNWIDLGQPADAAAVLATALHPGKAMLP